MLHILRLVRVGALILNTFALIYLIMDVNEESFRDCEGVWDLLRKGDYLDVRIRLGELIFTVETKEHFVSVEKIPLAIRWKTGIKEGELDVSQMALYLPYENEKRKGMVE